MSRLIWFSRFVCAGTVLAFVMSLAVRADDVPPRKPAQVMTFHGADWLERPEREQEEKPDEVIKTMGLKPGDVVADIGCGTGYFSRRMAKAVAPDGKVFANEIQPEFLEM